MTTLKFTFIALVLLMVAACGANNPRPTQSQCVTFDYLEYAIDNSMSATEGYDALEAEGCSPFTPNGRTPRPTEMEPPSSAEDSDELAEIAARHCTAIRTDNEDAMWAALTDYAEAAGITERQAAQRLSC